MYVGDKVSGLVCIWLQWVVFYDMWLVLYSDLNCMVWVWVVVDMIIVVYEVYEFCEVNVFVEV